MSGNLTPLRSSFEVLGVHVGAVQIPQVIHQMEEWISARNGSHFLALTSVDTIMQAWRNESFRQVLNASDLTVPDGMPLVWLGRLKGHNMKRRVYGPDLLLDFCRTTQAKGYRHFFYGGAAGVPAESRGRTLTALPSSQGGGRLFSPLPSLDAGGGHEVRRND